MSFDAVKQAIAADPELAAELKGAPTPAARAAILQAKGIPLPDPNSKFAEMKDVAGGSGSTTDCAVGANTVAAAS